MKKTITFLSAILFSIGLIGQTTLSPGDIAFIGFNLDGADDYAFVLLKDIDAATTITFTDRGWNDSGSFLNINGDATWTWTSGSPLAVGTVITITNGTSTSIGSVSGGAPTLSLIGDQILAYQGNDASPTFIAGMHSNFNGSTDANWDGFANSNSTSALPDQLTNGTNAIRLHNSNTEVDNWQYNCTVVSGDVTTVRAAINNIANWSNDNNTGFSPVAPACSWNITPPCDAAFSYAAASYCIDGTDPTPTITGTTGGTFSSTAGLSINPSNGAIDVSASTPNTYNVTYTASVGCSEDVSVTINALDDASFSYNATAFCVDAIDPTPTITGLTGGTFSSTPGLSISSNGTIDVSLSIPNTYTVTYTTAGTCPNSSSTSVTINALDNASFGYGASAYCQDASDPSPVITGLTGGTFSSTTGLSINSSNGAIDVSASTPNTYTVTYTTAGTCPNSSTTSITINALDDASFSYASMSYTTNDSDPTPTISGLTGGTFSSTAGLSISSSTGVIDLSASTPATYTITYTTAGACPNSSTTSVTINSGTVTWTGNMSNSWTTAGNWDTNTIPANTSDVIIPNNVTNYPTISSSVTVNSINIASGASLIANATVTAPVTYTRNLPTTNWYLVSAPVAGETQQDVIANHTFATGTGGNIGIGAFQNNTGPAWVFANNASTGPIISGAGVSMKLATAGDLAITGTINDTNVSFPVATGTRNNFNLIGNPFTSYVNSATLAGNNPVIENATFWLWDGSQYTAHNNARSIDIAPAQGFFVEANNTTNITFSTANQSHQTTDTFQKTTPTASFELFVENGDNKRATKVFYIEGKTTGFDSGYDSKIFGGVAQSFGVFTHLVSDNDGSKLAIQTLPNSNLNEMVIPVGVIAQAGTEVTFSLETNNFSEAVNVYLEDRINNTFTDITAGNTTVTVAEVANNIGQFYIHTQSKSLSTNTQTTATISIYASAKSEITVTGLQGKANVTLFSLLGKQVVSKQINSNGNSTILLPNLPTGIYIANLQTSTGTVTKKIIIE